MEQTIPAHVPSHLVVDLNMYDLPGAAIDPHVAWRSFCGKGALVFSPYNGGHWVPATGEDAMAVLQQHDLFSSASVVIPAHNSVPLVPIESDEPEHSDYRRTVLQFVTPAAVAQLEPEIRSMAIDLIEELRPRGHCEFMSDFALKLPIISFLMLMGLPLEDRLQLRGIVDKLIHDPDWTERGAAHNTLNEYVERWVNTRRSNPGEDTISKIIMGNVSGRPFTQDEICGTVRTLLAGSLDTVTETIGFWAHYLAAHPEDRDRIRVRGDKLMPVMNELQRRFSIANLGRIVAHDGTYKGIELRKGDRVMVAPAIYNLDETLYPDPERVNFERPQLNRQLGFGAGIHTCIGVILARCEMKIFLQEWLTRIPNFELWPGRPASLGTAQTNSINNLWLRWDVDKN